MNYLKYFFLLFLILTVTSCSKKKQKAEEKVTIQKSQEESGGTDEVVLTFAIVGSENIGYGYTIMADNRMIINQPTIPGQPGNKGFDTKEKAGKVAQLVIDKIKNNQMPPSVSKAELDSLHVLSVE